MANYHIQLLCINPRQPSKADCDLNVLYVSPHYIQDICPHYVHNDNGADM